MIDNQAAPNNSRILLRDIWPIENTSDYKIHFARRNEDGVQPLEIWVRNKNDWQSWQETKGKRNYFNRPFIFSLIDFYHEKDIWLFGGIFRVVKRLSDRYKVELLAEGAPFIGRLKLRSPYRSRQTRVKFENYYNEFTVEEILREPYSGRIFPGYEDIDLSFDELETIVGHNLPDWRAALESVKGVYLITDGKTGRQYVGSAYGEQGIWSRWSEYADSGHGGNDELRTLVKKEGVKYCHANFRLALLEQRSARTPSEVILNRERFWKDILRTRVTHGKQGLNRN